MLALPTSFLPSVHYLARIKAEGKAVVIYVGEPYRKRSFRSRTALMTANGVCHFSIPIKSHSFPVPPSSEIEISEHGKWRHRLMETLRSGYGSAPFWEIYCDELEDLVFDNSTHMLVEYNQRWLEMLCRVWSLTAPPIVDQLQEGTPFEAELLDDSYLESLPAPRYWQVFEQEMGFVKHLSALDLLLHLGPEGVLYLRRIALDA
ncbi:MAG: WbqC family protein [Porphyromonas sp.]|nr:WbqC family protein [Porphyromonas sp.]